MSTTQEYVQGNFRDADTVHIIMNIPGGAVFHLKGFHVMRKENFVIMAKTGNYAMNYSKRWGKNHIIHTRMVLFEKKEVYKRLKRNRDETVF